MSESDFKATYPLFRCITSDGGRRPVVEAVHKTLSRYVEKIYTPIGHLLPPRCGKSSIIHGIGAELREAGCPATFVLVPWDSLANQLVRTDSVTKSVLHYGIRHDFVNTRVGSITNHKFYEREVGGVDLLSMTMGLAHSNRQNLNDAIDTLKGKGKPPCVIVDEAHLIAMQNIAWGETLRGLVSAGAFVVGLTGTSERADMEPIPGFRVESIGEETPVERQVFDGSRIEDGKTIVRLRCMEGTRGKYKVVPIDGADYLWREAFTAGWMNKINFIPIDFNIKDNMSGEVGLLSDMKKTQVRKNLSEWLGEDICITLVCEKLLDRLNQWRAKYKEVSKGALVLPDEDPIFPQALIVTKADERAGEGGREKGANWHARTIRKTCEELLSLHNGGSPSRWEHLANLNIQVATSSDDSGAPDKMASGKIEDFTKGSIDILLVKYMALVGMDAPGCKVMANMSSLRDGPLSLQMISRICTIYEMMLGHPGDFICPADAMHMDLITRICEQGGGQIVETLTNTGEVIDKEAKDKEEDDFGLVSGAGVLKYAAEDGSEYEGDREAILAAVKAKYPQVRQLSDVAIMRLHDCGGVPVVVPAVAQGGGVRVDVPTAAQGSGPSVDVPTVAQGSGPSVDVPTVAQGAGTQKTRPVTVRNLQDDLKKVEAKFGKTAKKYANKIAPYRVDQIKWRTAVSKIQSEAKKACGVYQKVPTIEDPDLLNRLVDALPAAYEKVAEEGLH